MIDFEYTWRIKEAGYIYDGDSFKDYTIDLGFNKDWNKKDLRLYGIDTPEVRGASREAGLLVRDLNVSLHEMNPDATLWIKSIKDSEHKYGEVLCVYYIDDFNLNDFLLKNKYAKPYFGGTKPGWTKTELQYIVKKLSV